LFLRLFAAVFFLSHIVEAAAVSTPRIAGAACRLYAPDRPQLRRNRCNNVAHPEPRVYIADSSSICLREHSPARNIYARHDVLIPQIPCHNAGKYV